MRVIDGIADVVAGTGTGRRSADLQGDFHRLGHRLFARVDADQRRGAKVVDEDDVHAAGRQVGVESLVGLAVRSATTVRAF
jgi:hypothetical protein